MKFLLSLLLLTASSLAQTSPFTFQGFADYVKTHPGKARIVITGVTLLHGGSRLDAYKQAYLVKTEFVRRYGVGQDQIRISAGGQAGLRGVFVELETK